MPATDEPEIQTSILRSIIKVMIKPTEELLTGSFIICTYPQILLIRSSQG
jgi:hypothetical protein